MFKALAIFVVGVYAGIYIDQKYKIPNVSDPQQIYEKVKELMDQHKKDE